MASLRTYAAWGVTCVGLFVLPGLAALSWEGVNATFDRREMKPWIPVFIAGQRAGMIQARGLAGEIWRFGRLGLWICVPFVAFGAAVLIYWGREGIERAIYGAVASTTEDPVQRGRRRAQ